MRGLKFGWGLFYCLLLGVSCTALADDNLENARKLFAAQEYKESVKILKKITKESPSNVEAWMLLGDCYGAMGKNEDAIESYQQAVRMDSRNTDALLRLGVAYAAERKHANAIEAYQMIIRIQPENPEAHFYLGVIYDRIGRIGQAFEEYKILKTLDEGLAGKLYEIILGSG